METQTLTIENKATAEVKTGHEFLNEMCSFFADFNAFKPRLNPMTNRAEYIRFQLQKMGVPFEVDMFNARNPEQLNIDQPKYVNLYSFFKGQNANDETIVLLAHHDIANVKSENCQDNTASVCNLLHLCGLLKGKILNKNVLIVWTDAEEIVSPATCGAKRLAILSKLGFFGKVTEAINLELTANGECLWISTLEHKELANEIASKYNGQRVKTPYNDAFVLEKNGMKSVCIGTLTERELEIAIQQEFCQTWALCHSEEDIFYNANANEMKSFVENVLLVMALA